MALYLDSADLAEIDEALHLGFVSGVTTNPAIMRRSTGDPLRHAHTILAAFPGTALYYQPAGAYESGSLDEAIAAWDLGPDRVTIKVPCTPRGIALARQLTIRGIEVALTAAQTPSAMVLAEALHANCVIPYVDRATRDPRVRDDLVAALARVRRRPSTAICAASLKSAEQCVAALADGADSITAPLGVLHMLLEHPAALEAEAAFDQEYADTDLPIPLPGLELVGTGCPVGDPSSGRPPTPRSTP